MSQSEPKKTYATERMQLMHKLVDEVTKDTYDVEKVKALTSQLGIIFSDDPLQLLNNVLKGIHQRPEVTHEPLN